MSRDDASLSRHSLFSDDNQEETDSLLDREFTAGIRRMYPHLDLSSLGKRSTATSTSTGKETSAKKQNPSTTPLEVLSKDVPARSLVGVSRPSRAYISDEGASVLSSKGNDGASLHNNDRRRSTGSIPLPSLTPQSVGNPPSAANAIGATHSKRSNGSKPSQRKQKKERLLRTFYSEVWWRRDKNPNIMVLKQMCIYCKVVVGNHSRSMLQHTGNCGHTSIISKRNALDQSRDKTKPVISHDSTPGPDEEKVDTEKKADRSRKVSNALDNGNSISPTSSEHRGKKRKAVDSGSKKQKRKRPLSTEEVEDLDELFLKVVTSHNLPLSIYDRRDTYQSDFMDLLRKACPYYFERCSINSKSLRGKHLNTIYARVRRQVLKKINRPLGGLHAYGTIMFDGWEDVNGNAVVNVMIRVSSSLIFTHSTYFLDSVYTKEKKVNAEKFVKILAQLMNDVNSKASSPFMGINGVVGDSARVCVKAKKLLAEKYAGMVTIQDQAHGTDLLMTDLGQLPWVQEILSKVSTVVLAMKNNRKLASRYKDLIKEYNVSLQTEEPWNTIDDNELDIMDRIFNPGASEAPEALDRTAEVDDQYQQRADRRCTSPWFRGSIRPSVRGRGRPPRSVRPTAVTLKKMAKTRFASSQTMLEGFLRSQAVLETLTEDSEFERLYGNREKRKEFASIVADSNLIERVEEVHEILRIIRRYLRIWDAEGCQVSEVAPATIFFGAQVEKSQRDSFSYL